MMSHKNYSKFSSKKDNNNKIEDMELTTTENEEIIIENIENEPLIESTSGLNQVIDIKPIIGFVSDCNYLYVREYPSTESNFLTIISKATEVMIDSENSTEDFYKVKTSEGIEGYCMKKFITIK